MQEPVTNDDQDIFWDQPFSGDELSLFIDDMYAHFLYHATNDGNAGSTRSRHFRMYRYLKSRLFSETPVRSEWLHQGVEIVSASQVLL